tara:strand:+ start:78 stop:326 length:249 start_codon:yes stop_codon:yes gene_type:complete
MTVRLALQIMKMSKAAIQKKWGKAGLSKVINARLLLKKEGYKIGKYTRKKATQKGMVGKIMKPTKKGKSEMKSTWASGFMKD